MGVSKAAHLKAGAQPAERPPARAIREESGAETAVKPTVFIHTNDRQIVGALVAQHALKRNSQQSGRVRRPHHRDQGLSVPRAHGRASRSTRDGIIRIWRNDDLQSFTPLRFMPPELMGYRGPGAGHRSRHLRGRRRLGAAVARHAGHGDHVPPAQRAEGQVRLLRLAASCCSTAPGCATGAARSSSTSCSRSSATTWTGSP